MNKKGTSLVELIAIIVIMGIIAGIASVSIISVVERQKKNAVINTMNNIYNSAKIELYQVETGDYDEHINNIDNEMYYISLSSMIDGGMVDGSDYKSSDNEVYFCYNRESNWVVITSDTLSKEIPESTGNALINNVSITFDYIHDKFKKV